MRTAIEKRSGGLAVIVPQPLAAEAGLHAGGPAMLDGLLVGITPDNLHGEWAEGPPVGSELLRIPPLAKHPIGGISSG